MSKTVYANGNAVACKHGDLKVVAAFPDICKSPPGPPTGPIPVPYAVTSFARDLRKGSKTVKIGGQPIALKNQSYFKSSPLGDEAATTSFGAGIASQQMAGKTYFGMWSMDVRAEGMNLCRHLDIATSNHGSNANTLPGPGLDKANLGSVPAAAAEEPKCECCGQKLHDGQRDADGNPAPVVSEEQWYMIGPEEDAALEAALQELIDNEPPKLDKRRTKRFDQQLDKLAERERKLAHRREWIAWGKEAGCKSLPEPPCDVYRVTPNGAAKEIEGEWLRACEKYRNDRKFPSGMKTNHRVPKTAGGCPGSSHADGNLVHDSELDDDCLQFDDDVLTKMQSDCSKEWSRRLAAGWSP